MALNFPNSPTTNDTYTFGGKTWVYNGSAWDLQATSLNTTLVVEGANLYYTNARARGAISVTGAGTYDSSTGIITVTGGVTSVGGYTGDVTVVQLANAVDVSGILTTANVDETTNLYYTNARTRQAISVTGAATYDNSTGVINVTGGVTSVAGAEGAVSNTQLASGITTSGLLTSANVSELTNLYFTNARSRQSISVTGAATYDNSTGVINVTGGVTSVGGATGAVSNSQLASAITSSGILTTANVAEGTNQYYTDAKVYAAISGNLALKANVVDLTTANVAELNNLYYTNARVYANVTERIANLDGNILPAVTETYNLGSATRRFKDLYLSGNTIQLGDTTLSSSVDGLTINSIRANVWNGIYTANVLETSDNLYFTNARVVAAVSNQTLGNATFSGNVSVGGTLNVTGNLNVVGNVTTFNSTVVEIADTLIYLGTGNSGDVEDIGFVGHFTNPGYQHTGFVRDATDGVWKLFANVASEPTNNTLVFTTATYSPLKIGALDASTGAFSGNVTTGNVSGTAGEFTASRLGTVESGTWNGSSISTTYTDAKIVSVSNTAPISATTTAGAVTVGLLNSGVTASTYGNATIVPVITVDAFGRVTSASNVSISAAGGLSNWITKTGNYTAAVSDRILANTSAGAFTITLPSSPTTGSEVYIADGNNFSTANVTIARNGSLIDQTAEDLVLDIGGAAVQLVYDGTSNWAVYFYSVLPEPADITLSTVPPANPRVGDHWVDDSDGTDYTYIFDGDSYQWVNFGSTGMLLTDDTSSSSTLYPMMTANTSGVPSVVTTSSTKLYYNPNTGTLSATSLNSVSDAKYKHSIKPVLNAIDIINQIKPVEFNWVDNGRKSYGVIAQELEQIMPELVDTNEAGDKAVSYIPMIALLLAAVKEQQKEIEELKSKLNGN